MSIGRRVVLAVTFQKVDAAPHAQATTQGDHESLQYVNSTVEEIHKSFFLSFCRIVVVGFQSGCVQFVHIERLVRLHNGRSAFHPSGTKLGQLVQETEEAVAEAVESEAEAVTEAETKKGMWSWLLG